MATKSILVKSLIPRQEFSYTKDEVTLKFNLRVDNSSELKVFKSCLEEAIKDIDNVMKGMKS